MPSLEEDRNQRKQKNKEAHEAHLADQLSIVTASAFEAVTQLKGIFNDAGIATSETRENNGALHFTVDQGQGIDLDFAVASYKNYYREQMIGLSVEMQMTFINRQKPADTLSRPGNVILKKTCEGNFDMAHALLGNGDNTAAVAKALVPVILKQRP